MMSEDKPHRRPADPLPGPQMFRGIFFLHLPSKFSAFQSQFLGGFLAPNKANREGGGGGDGGKAPAADLPDGCLNANELAQRGRNRGTFDFFVF